MKFSGKFFFLTKKHILNSYIETENRSFPKRKIDLKCQKLDGLDLPENHPGEADEKYKERRNKTKALVQNCGMKIPKIDYHQDKIKIIIILNFYYNFHYNLIMIEIQINPTVEVAYFVFPKPVTTHKLSH